MAGDAKKIPEEIGQVVTYRVEEQLSIHIWAVVGVGDDIETVQNNLRAMLTHVDDLIRLSATLAPGIQFIKNNPGWRSMDDRERKLVLHRVADITAIYYETLTSLPIPPIAPFLLADIGAADQSSAG